MGMAYTLPAPLFRTKERYTNREDDQSWVLERARQGDPKAVALLYDRHHAPVRAFAARMLGDDSTAEDLVHEVFVILPKALRNFRGDSALQSYIMGIAANRSRHYIRKASRRRAAQDRMIQSSEVSTNNPETDVQRKELATMLRRAIESLPHDQRTAFVLCEVEERSSADVAEIVGIPAATVRTRLFHARRKLRTFLEREGAR